LKISRQLAGGGTDGVDDESTESEISSKRVFQSNIEQKIKID